MGGHPWDPGPGRVGSAAEKALLVPSAGTNCRPGPEATASQPGMAQGPHPSIQGYHNNGNSHRSPLLGMVALPGTTINSQTSSAPEVTTIINPFYI